MLFTFNFFGKIAYYMLIYNKFYLLDFKFKKAGFKINTCY